MIEHVPIASVVILSPDTVQVPVVFDVNVTVSPELEVAPLAKVSPVLRLPGLTKEIV